MNGARADDDVSKNGHFIPVENPQLFIPILKERHPESCFMYNQVIVCDKFKGRLKFFTLSEGISSESWLISVFVHGRDGIGHDISISAPNSVVRDKQPIPSEIKESFSSGKLIDWVDQANVFIALERPVSAMIFDVFVNVKGNIVEVHPCILYYVDKEDALDISVGSSPGTELKRLDPDKGTEFIMSTWKYAQENFRSNITRCIEATASAGVFVGDKCASGVVTFGDGIIHCLYTMGEYRQRGFAKLTMKYCFKEYAKEGCHPCTTVEVQNQRSIAFHEALGAKSASFVDYIDVKKLNVD